MAQRYHLLSEERGLIAIGGDDRTTFLQGLVSNDVSRVFADRAVYAALLTPQGRYLHDFFIAAIGETLYLDCEASRRDDLRRRLSIYRLRSKATLADATSDFAVTLLYGTDLAAQLGLDAEPGAAKPWEGGVVYVDPRLAELGARAILPRTNAADILAAAGFVPGHTADYDRLRLSLGVPDGSRDLPVEKAILLENGFDELHGIDWQKGCYMGQELTARTRYRGLVRKRLLPVEVDGPLPAPGTHVMAGDKEVGEMRSGVDGLGLALLRLEHLDDGESLRCGESRLKPRRPAWARL
ncbi:MAG: folate-binding protein [Rhodospirillales bacterium]|nr:folate-binding protein [Rhodospirillales bacterium]